MKSTPGSARSFGVSDYDAYWVGRKAAGTDALTRLQKHLAALVEEFVLAGGKVLDCGVGPGNVYRLLRQTGRETYGVEISQEAFSLYDFDASRIVKHDLNEGLPDFGLRFDAIIAAHILHHLRAPEDFLRAAKDALAPEGVLLAAIPNITFYRFRIAFLFGRFPPVSLAHVNFQTPSEAEAMFRRAGYTVVKRTTAKKALRARLFPTLFSQDIVYVLSPAASAGASLSPRE